MVTSKLRSVGDITMDISLVSTATIGGIIFIWMFIGLADARGNLRLMEKDTFFKVLRIKLIVLSVSIGCIIIAYLILQLHNQRIPSNLE